MALDAPDAGPFPQRPFNGDFEFGADSSAGWAYHGGGLPLTFSEESDGGISNVFLRLSPQTSLSRRHNRLWIGPQDVSLQFDLRSEFGVPPEEFQVLLTDTSGVDSELAGLVATGPPQSGWVPIDVLIPPELRGTTHTLTFLVNPPVLPEFELDIDNIEIVTGSPPRADLNSDGVVGPIDLVMLLGQWGACYDGESCPSDMNSDGVVGPIDLAILLEQWGSR